MKMRIFLAMVGLASCAAWAQAPIYRCGNEYTNNKPDGRDCKLLSGGNLTVIQSTPPPTSAAAPAASTGKKPAAGNVASSPEQARRDSDARLILQAELGKARARQQQLQAEYNNGEPEKQGPETRNHQKYLDRVESLKASLARVASDIAGIEREIDRLAPAGR